MKRKTRLSRREFTTLVATSAVASAVGAPVAFSQRSSASVTAGAIIGRIRQNIGVDWQPDTVDTVKAGDPATIVTGIVTSSMATLDVLRRAVDVGANLVITAEPTFYSRVDARTPPAGRGRGRGRAGAAPPTPPPPPPADPVFAAKNEFISENGLVVFRLKEHWGRREPDPFAQGIGHALGWTTYQAAGNVSRYDIPSVSLGALASGLQQRLGVRGGMRVIGDSETSIQSVALLPGSTSISASLEALPGVDAVLAGEVREWESVEYARDVVFSGQNKGFILVGRVVSEEAGMGVCAEWIETFVPEVPVRHIAAGDPYWRPA